MEIRRKIHGKIKAVVILTFISITAACYHYPEIDDSLYEEYRRVIGPEGGTINFFRNYENDSIKDRAATIEFSANAVETYTVFNMYEYGSSILDVDLISMNREAVSGFLYFVPFYESAGYNEHSNEESLEHISISFQSQVKVIYYLNTFETYEDAVLYKINIPAKNEWGTGVENNMWINYNNQGYPNGYNEQDLMYIINGRWTENYSWGTGSLSFDNWEEVSDYNYDISNKTVSFQIDDTDYIYVMAVDSE